MFENNSPFTTPNAAKPFQPVVALCLHSNGHDVIATTHRAKQDGELGTGRIVDLTDAISILQASNKASTARSGWVVDHVVYDTPNLLVWSAPSQRKRLWFSVASSATESIDVVIPQTIFVLRRDRNRNGNASMAVFACKNGALKAHSKLYHAPYMNVNSKGVICQGSANLPTHVHDTTSELLAKCEATLFDSVFTHTNHCLTWRPNKGSDVVSDVLHVARWKQLQKAAKAPRMADLVKCPFDLGDVINDYDRGEK